LRSTSQTAAADGGGAHRLTVPGFHPALDGRMKTSPESEAIRSQR
jgi:hypothetical protein